MKRESGYVYFESSNSLALDMLRIREGAIALGQERFNPSLCNPDFLILRQRVALFRGWLQNLPGKSLKVLDVGGRIQPYRPLVEGRLKHYVAIDPQASGLLDAIGVGENLPFRGNLFDLVICTQTLGYVTEPLRVIAEIYRVLKPGGALLLSVPAFFPRTHDERWRFLPDGLSVLLSSFSSKEIAPEGYSIAGLFRTFNVCLITFIQKKWLRRIILAVVIPAANMSGVLCDRFCRGNNQLTANYSVLALK